MISRYKALIFDMDGTLLDSMGFWRRQSLEFLRARNLPVPDEMVGRELEYTASQSADLFIRTYGLRETVGEIINEGERGMLDKYRFSIGEKAGSLSFLRQAHGRGYRMCVATAAPYENAMVGLDKHGMTPYLDFVMSSSDVGISKREPEFFERVAARLCLPAKDCLVFEDTLSMMKAAKRAGCGVYAISEPIFKREWEEIGEVADRRFDHYDQLLPELS